MIVNAGDDQALLQEAGLPLLVSEAQIAVHWREEEYYQHPPRFIGQANASDPSLFEPRLNVNNLQMASLLKR